MSKKVLLVGHCGPDASYLRMVVRSADKEVRVVLINDEQQLRAALDEEDIDLILFNRELGYGFTEEEGVSVIKWLKPNYPSLRMMLVSNYPEAQSAAVAAGALPGFGKREVGTARARQMLNEALNGTEDDT
jgi:two-component system, chemotaxis family, chemotaxis protein CheY